MFRASLERRFVGVRGDFPIEENSLERRPPQICSSEEGNGSSHEELGAKLIVYASLFDAYCGPTSPCGVLKPSIHFGIVGEGLASFDSC